MQVVTLNHLLLGPPRRGGLVYIPAGKIIRFIPTRVDGENVGSAVYLAGMYERPYNYRTGEPETKAYVSVWQSCEEIADMLDPRRAFSKRPNIDKAAPAFMLDRDLLDG